MAKPTQSIFPVENGKLITNLDCNNLQLVNLDESNLSGGGGGGGGNDTGITTAILKGDGNHGFADAISDQDYASVGSVQLRELSVNHDADMVAVNDELSTLNTALVGISGDVSGKADLTYVDTQLAAKADDADLQAYITSNDAEVALKAYTTSVNSALSTKADTSLVTTGLATKEPLLPTSSNDGFVLVRDADETWRFVDPVTLGSTNASYGDGATHSNTTFNSTLAVFTTNDTGKTIVCSGNIPDDTEITFVNATTVTLSNAATTTASGLTFTILNRFLAAGGGGTVTSVGVNPSFPTNVGSLFSAQVGNPTTSAVITFAANTSVGANTFYGNGTTFSGSAGFMSAGVARTSLGGTTVGQAVFQLANPSQVGFIRTNVDNTVTALTSAATLSALGAESALTFSAPLARATNTISIPAATSLVSGHLTATDWATFNSKAASTRTITTTTPLTIDGAASADLSANRTIAMPAATDTAAGYLTAADHAAFVAKPPNSRTIATTAPLTGGGDLSANRTFAIPKATSTVDGYLAAADFLRFNLGGGSSLNVSQGVPAGTATIDPAAVPPITKVYLTSPLNQSLNIILPAAAPYAANNLSIEIIDVVTGGAAPGTSLSVTVSRSGSDTVDGLTTPVPLAEGTTYTRFFPNAANRWFSTKYYVDSFKDPVDATKRLLVDVGGFSTASTRTLRPAPGADSVTVIPTTLSDPGVIFNIDSSGVATKAQLNPTNLLPQEHTVGQAGINLSLTSYTVSATGGPDTVRIAGTLTVPITIIWPPASLYNSGETVSLLDASGSVTSTNKVTVVVTGTDTFNGVLTSFVFDETNGRKALTSDGTSNWSVSLQKTSVQPFQIITPVGTTYTIVADPGAVRQNARMTLQNGTNSLLINNAYDGMPMELFVVQPASGAAGTLFLPPGSYVAGSGLGVIALTATNGAIDRLRGSFVGALNAMMWDAPAKDYSTAAVPSAPSLLAAGTVTASSVALTWQDNSTVESGFRVERKTGAASYGALSPTVGAVSGTGGTGSFTDNTVAPSTTYNYRVIAFNAGGDSSASNVISVTTSAATTADLWEVHFNEGTLNSAGANVGPNATLTYADWTTATQSATGAAFNPSLGLLPTTTPLTISVQGTAGTTTYQYKVLAYKSVTGFHNSAVANTTITTGNATLSATNFNRITWAAVTGADYYKIFRGTKELITTPTPYTALTIDDTGLALGSNIPADNLSSTDVHTATALSTVNYATSIVTVSFWCKSTYTATAANNIISAGPTGFQIRCTSGQLFSITFPGTGGTVCTGTTSNNVSSNGSSIKSGSDWHHITVIVDASNAVHTANDIKVYFDGGVAGVGAQGPRTVAYTTSTNTGPYVFPASAPVVGSGGFAGAIDDVRIFTGALTTTQITTLFTDGAK